MSLTAIPLEFEKYLQNQISVGDAPDMNEMIFAYVPDLDLEQPIDREQGLPDVAYWVHQQDIDQVGKVGDNALVYSVVIPGSVAAFTFNAIYLRDKNVPKSCGMVIHKAEETKEDGMASTKSLMQQYTGAAQIAGINVDAATWQIDYQARLKGIDEDYRLANIDIYGHTAIIEGFEVTQEADPTKYTVAAGTAYIGGLRTVLESDLLHTITTTPNNIYLDVVRDGTALSKWKNLLTITVSESTLTDYEDVEGKQHYVAKVATINSDGSVSMEPNEFSYKARKKALEDVSGGKNTLIVDDQGNPNVMVRIPRFTYEDVNAAILANTGVDLQLGTGTPTMFISNGVHRGEVLIAKYLASAGANGGCSVVGGVQPRVSVDYDTAKALCESKGEGWHMMSIHEWAAIALWAYANQSVPRGNTNYGRAHDNKIETARRADNGIPGDGSGSARTDTGKGPATWGHDHTEFGIQDLVGNVWEWLDQMKLDNGQIITTNDNDPSIAEVNWIKHGAYLDSSSDSSEGTGNIGSPILSNAVMKRNGPINDDSNNYPYTNNEHFAALTQSAGYQPLELLRRLLIESAETTNVTGAIWARNYGNRLPMRGGYWYYGPSSGLGSLNLSYARTFSAGSIGFRPACFV